MNAQPLETTLRGRLRHNESMARHTTWRVGGTADRFYLPSSTSDLAEFIGRLPKTEPVYWVGLGSNLLVRDGGLRGTVICTAQVLGHCEVLQTHVRAQAGVACARVAKLSVEAGLTGAEFLIGIPGTLGGALAMNAGAFGADTWSLVSRVETLDRAGHRRWRDAGEYTVGYRSVHGPIDEWFIAVELQLATASGSGRAELKRLLELRATTQPIGQLSCGSVFRNPPTDFAARLIEQCNLKGLRVGGAQVSEKHANFIVNLGSATASDIETLIETVRAKVASAHGVDLTCEVKIVGEYLSAVV